MTGALSGSVVCQMAAVMALLSVLFVSGCRKPSDSAKSELEDVDYQLTNDDWFRAARENRVAVMKRFMDAGFDVQSADESGRTALHEAAAAGALEAADILLDLMKIVDLPGEKSRTPLMEAALADRAEMIRWLVRQGADPSRKDAEGFSALMLAVRHGKPNAVEELASVNDGSLDPALQVAALYGQSEVIDPLTSYGASVYVRMEDGRTPLMLAAENGHVETVKILLDVGASRYATDNEGLSAADYAGAGGHHELAKLIMEEPETGLFSLDSPAFLGAEMNAAIASRESGGNSEAADSRHTKPPVVSLAGVVLEPTDGPPASDEKEQSSPSTPPLVVRSYQERELPVRVVTVDKESAELEIFREGTYQRNVVKAGQTVPGTTLQVVRAERRMQESKITLGEQIEVSVVEVRDPATGETREWMSGAPASAHDPVALVEDAATGRRYVASPGQHFRGRNGSEFVVSDVRPNQLVISSVETGEVVTLPLRGPRG